MPFGAGRFECPAKSLFAPMFIRILVVALMSGLDDGYGLAWDVDSDGLTASGPLKAGRCSYPGLCVTREKEGAGFIARYWWRIILALEHW